MKRYCTTQIVEAEPMSAYDFLLSRPFAKIGLHRQVDYRPGYLIKDEKGREMWAPKDEFEKEYLEIKEEEISNG